MPEQVMLVFTVPETDADKVRQALGDAGAGKMGDYSHASFSNKGIGRFVPMSGASPAIGQKGKLEEVAEERVEMVCTKAQLQDVITVLKQVHPYEEPAIAVYPLLSF